MTTKQQSKICQWQYGCANEAASGDFCPFHAQIETCGDSPYLTKRGLEFLLAQGCDLGDGLTALIVKRDELRQALCALEMEISLRFGSKAKYDELPNRMSEPLATLIRNARAALDPKKQ